jgi:hypothetical protein
MDRDPAGVLAPAADRTWHPGCACRAPFCTRSKPTAIRSAADRPEPANLRPATGHSSMTRSHADSAICHRMGSLGLAVALTLSGGQHCRPLGRPGRSSRREISTALDAFADTEEAIAAIPEIPAAMEGSCRARRTAAAGHCRPVSRNFYTGRCYADDPSRPRPGTARNGSLQHLVTKRGRHAGGQRTRSRYARHRESRRPSAEARRTG